MDHREESFRSEVVPNALRRGFTLIELLLVLMILSVLAALIVPRYAQRAKQARVTAARTQISLLESALDAFEIDTGRYPTSQEGLDALVMQPPGLEGWQSAYIRRVPVDPWGHPYIYECPGEHNTDGYDIHSLGPSGQEGGADNIDNWTAK